MINMNPINPLNIRENGPVPGPQQTDDPKKLMEVCREFESIFINMILQQSRSGINAEGLTEKSYAREIFEGMQDEQMAQSMSKGQGVGLAQQLYKQLSRNTNRVINVDSSE